MSKEEMKKEIIEEITDKEVDYLEKLNKEISEKTDKILEQQEKIGEIQFSTSSISDDLEELKEKNDMIDEKIENIEERVQKHKKSESREIVFAVIITGLIITIAILIHHFM